MELLPPSADAGVLFAHIVLFLLCNDAVIARLFSKALLKNILLNAILSPLIAEVKMKKIKTVFFMTILVFILTGCELLDSLAKETEIIKLERQREKQI